MNEKQKKQLEIAARYGRCDEKYLGELIDQIRMAGVDKTDLREICHTITYNTQDPVGTLFRDFINDDQYQRFFACIQAEAEMDVYMAALEYAFLIYGDLSGHRPAPNAKDKEVLWERIIAAAENDNLTCGDMIELADVFPDFAGAFQKAFESFVDHMDAWSPEDIEKTQRIIELLTGGKFKTKSRKILDMRALQDKNVTSQSDGARKLSKYFSLRQIRYLNAKMADHVRLSDAILQKIDASFVRNLICSGDDEAEPYTEAEKELLLQVCDRELKPKIDGYSRMRDYVQEIRTDQCGQPKLTEENWMFLYREMVCGIYKKGFMSFLGILRFDCLAEENRNRWMAVTEYDRYELLQGAIRNVSSKADENAERKDEILKEAINLFIWTMQQNGTEINEETKLKTCIQYAGSYTPVFIQAGLVQYQAEAFEEFWNYTSSLFRLDNWTIRILLKRYQETSRVLPDNVFTNESSDFFAAMSHKEDPFTKEERFGLFELYADTIYQYQPLGLLKLYEYMLREDIPFADYMEAETAMELAKTLLQHGIFPIQKEAILKNLFSEEEFANYLEKTGKEKANAEELGKLRDLQQETGKAVTQLLMNPKAFLSRYKYSFCQKEKDLMILKILKNINVRMMDDYGMLDEILYQSMMLNRNDIFKYAESMTEAASALKDPYFLQVLAKRVRQMTDPEWDAAIGTRTEE